jgi:hypothetical protein
MTNARLRPPIVPSIVPCLPALLACLPLLILLCLAFVSRAQDAALDASEISRDLLYAAPSRVERRSLGGDTYWYALVGRRFAYAWLSAGPPKNFQWQVSLIDKPASAKPAEQKGVFAVGESSRFELVGHSDDDRATLALRKKGAPEVLGTVTLWDRDQLVQAWLPEVRKEKRGTTADGLRQDLEVADPEVRATIELNGQILAAVGQSSGEEELGLATIVKFNTTTFESSVFHPAGMLTCEVSTMTPNLNASARPVQVWFGTRRIREGTIAPCGGVFNLDTQALAVTPPAGRKNPPIGSVVTLLSSEGAGGLALATDAGICQPVGGTADDWKCWRFVPTATLTEEVAVANRPGDKPYGQLKAGDYEVLWANQNYLEVVTPDSYDAWLAASDYAEAAGRNFDVEPYKLLNTATGGPTPIRPLSKPNGEPLSGALVFRAALEKLAAPAGTPDGWVKVRARVGWIARKNVDVAPRLVPAPQ